MTHPRRLTFIALETPVIAIPVALSMADQFEPAGRISGGMADGLWIPFALGLIGLIAWMIRFNGKEARLTRIGLGSLLFVVFSY